MAQQRIPLNTPLDPNQPVQSFLELKMAIITARLATMQSLIQQRNTVKERGGKQAHVRTRFQ